MLVLALQWVFEVSLRVLVPAGLLILLLEEWVRVQVQKVVASVQILTLVVEARNLL
jgi:hypothetical protein